MSINVTIGIQARSNSQRFPNKIMAPLGSKPVLDHVIDACKDSASYINRSGTKGIHVEAVLCIPKDDPVGKYYMKRCPIFEGPENDVLARYALMSEQYKSDFIVRVTGDCPLIPPFVISKCITAAVMGQYDYIANVAEECRTSFDGMDCEVISSHTLKIADAKATALSDREHVTTFIRKHRVGKQGTVVNFLDLSHLKLSLDTREDLVRIEKAYQDVQNALGVATSLFGARNVHRL